LVVGDNGNGQNVNQIRCYTCRGVGHYAINFTKKSRVRDTTYYTKRLMLILQEEAGVHLTAKQYDFLAYASDEERGERGIC
nr:hypothetical protein [Tanacetum cinerariifolium]